MAVPSTSRITLRKDDEIYLVDNIEEKILGSKLPSNKQVLSVLLFNLRKVKFSLRDSATSAVDKVLIFWQKARIPTKRKDKCADKVEKLYNDLRDLEKRASR